MNEKLSLNEKLINSYEHSNKLQQIIENQSKEIALLNEIILSNGLHRH